LSKLRIPTPEAFIPLLEPARYKGVYGGRGSGKSHFFAETILEYALRWPGDHQEGLRFACIREIQKSLKESAKLLIEDKLRKFELTDGHGFRVWEKVIETPGDGMITFDGMRDHTADTFKSKEGFHAAWVEEAQSLSDRSLTILRPTIRWESQTAKSELWFSWNPQRPTDPVDQFLRSDKAPTDACVVKANWRDNPWFPRVLDQERRDDLENRPELYGHIWEGEYATVLSGAYYAKHLNESALGQRIGIEVADPLLPVHAFFDIGSTSKRADRVVIWVVQFVGNEKRILHYYEARGQEFASHAHWLRANGYHDAICVLPHDGKKHDVVYAVTPQSFLREAGFRVDVVDNQGRGAAIQRIEATRRIFNTFRFNEETTKAGRDALGWYHADLDEARGIDLGPDHDWSSHAADAFGMISIYDMTRKTDDSWNRPIRVGIKGIV
jgi:phage terminase large subunit